MTFHVGVTRDFLRPDGAPVWGDIGLDRLTDAGLTWEYLPDEVVVLRPEHTCTYDAMLIGSPTIDGDTFDAERNPKIFARFGVGYDAIDVAACTAHGAYVTITPDGARRAVATAALGLILAVKLNLVMKHQLVTARNWAPRVEAMGDGLTGNTIGLLGFGNIASELVKLVAPFECRIIAGEDWCKPERPKAHDIEVVSRSEFLAHSDIIVIVAPLTDATHHAVNAEFLAALKPTTIIINVARGAIIDEGALYNALRQGRIAGAGLDVFENEPADSPLLDLPNVTLAPHCLAWTKEMSQGNGASAVQAIIDVAQGRTPKHAINPDLAPNHTLSTRE